MRKNLEKIYLKLESKGLFSEYLTLYLLDLPSKGLLKNIDIKPKENEIFVFARGYNDKLKTGTNFNVLFSKNHIIDFIECNTIIKYISMNPKYHTDYLPSGYSGICLLEFEDKIPMTLMKKLPEYDSEINNKIHDKLILTQKPVIESLLNELKSS